LRFPILRAKNARRMGHRQVFKRFPKVRLGHSPI
jgi:hypothetical protein